MNKIVKFFLKKVIFNPQGFPIVFSITALGVLLVLFRMKGVEQDYNISDLEERKKTLLFENKEYKAKKANLLSIKNLQKMAEKYGLERPKREQIIIIP